MAVVSYRPRYLVQDYLQWEGDWELWDGIPVSMSPSPGYYHQTTATRLTVKMGNLLDDSSCPADFEVIHEIDWHVDASTVVRPDLMINCEKPSGQWIEKRPELAV